MQKITIKEPCQQDWNAMTPSEQGRHCQSCVKTVYDVSTLSDDEVWAKHKELGGSMCIRIPAHRASIAPRPWYIRMKYAVVAAGITLMLSIQQKLLLAQTDSTDNKVDSNVKTIENMKIKGIVLDSLSDENKVAFATIILFKNNKKTSGAFTNIEGKFEITANEEVNEKDKLHLEVSQVGVTTFTKKIETLKDSIDCEIYVKEEHVCLKEIVITMGKLGQSDREPTVMGSMPMGTHSITGVMTSSGSRKILDDFDTKTIYADEIQRFNLGR